MRLFWFAPVLNKEIRGLKLEIVGLTVVLLSILWQGTFADIQDRRAKAAAEVVRDFDRKCRQDHAVSLPAQLDAPSESWFARPDDSRDGGFLSIGDVARELNDLSQKFAFARLLIAAVGALLIIQGKYLVALHKAELATKPT